MQHTIPLQQDIQQKFITYELEISHSPYTNVPDEKFQLFSAEDVAWPQNESILWLTTLCLSSGILEAFTYKLDANGVSAQLGTFQETDWDL